MPEKLGHPRYLQSSDKAKKLKKRTFKEQSLNQRQFLIDQNIREKYVRCRGEKNGEITLKHQ
jgi:hypothetical protein